MLSQREWCRDPLTWWWHYTTILNWGLWHLTWVLCLNFFKCKLSNRERFWKLYQLRKNSIVEILTFDLEKYLKYEITKPFFFTSEDKNNTLQGATGKKKKTKNEKNNKTLANMFKLFHYVAILHKVPKDTIFMRLKKSPWLKVGWNGGGQWFLYVLLSPLWP